jgi:hypothetical protein
MNVEREMDSRPSASVESSVVIVPSQHTRATSFKAGQAPSPPSDESPPRESFECRSMD